ncbi:MAG: GTPase HflX [Planctomycetes bacterium]|nr:GTPase HflX [Planctomycetota bacterium]
MLLVSVLTPDDPDGSTVDELEDLVRTAGGKVIGRMTQGSDRLHPVTYVGKGKLGELKAAAEELAVHLVVANHDLSPKQARSIEKTLEMRVLDRSEVILDIFARNARSRQSKLQVELAQLEYARPRLKRLWTHLEGQDGGIGARGGPGEKQIEIDRRILDRRIRDLRADLREIAARKDREVEARAREFDTVALVGYTNAGKSSLAGRLTGADLLIADRLFSTLDTRTRSWVLPGGHKVLLSDSVGFLRRLPHHLIASFHATLSEAAHADLLLHVVDASHPQADRHVEAVEEVLARLGLSERPAILVLNKMDRVRDPLALTHLFGARESVRVSARTGEGIEELAAAARRHFDLRRPFVRVTFPAADGRLAAALHRHGSVAGEIYEGERVQIDVYLDRDRLARLEREPGVSVEILRE